MHAWIIPVQTDDNVLAVTKFGPWVWAAAAMISKEMFTTLAEVVNPSVEHPPPPE